MALIHFGRDQYLQASRRKFSSLWPPIGSKHKLIASYSFQDCSYLALAKKKKRKVILPFQHVAVYKLPFNYLGQLSPKFFSGVAFL